MTPVDMMRAMATMHNQPRLLASFVRSQLDVVAAAADKENKLARQGKVAEALKGSGVVQELAASLNRHHVLEYLPLLVEKVSMQRTHVLNVRLLVGSKPHALSSGVYHSQGDPG